MRTPRAIPPWLSEMEGKDSLRRDKAVGGMGLAGRVREGSEAEAWRELVLESIVQNARSFAVCVVSCSWVVGPGVLSRVESLPGGEYGSP